MMRKAPDVTSLASKARGYRTTNQGPHAMKSAREAHLMQTDAHLTGGMRSADFAVDLPSNEGSSNSTFSLSEGVANPMTQLSGHKQMKGKAAERILSESIQTSGKSVRRKERGSGSSKPTSQTRPTRFSNGDDVELKDALSDLETSPSVRSLAEPPVAAPANASASHFGGAAPPRKRERRVTNVKTDRKQSTAFQSTI
jgi:hypothetical protein